MAKIVLLANLNCDRILRLDKALQSGGRFHYQDGGMRIGGGGANTGIGLAWAGHRVALVSEVGKDKMGDWLLAEASTQGLDCHLISRREGATSEMLLVMTPDGERTIIRPQRPTLELSLPPHWQNWDALYINSSAQGAISWAKTAIKHCLVMAQLAKDNRSRPCHILLASSSDLEGRSSLSPWEFGLTIGGKELKYFIVTHGAKGAELFSANGRQFIAAVPAKVIDTTGAGDAYGAGIIHGLCSGMSIEESMVEAAKWGAFAVSTSSSIPGDLLRNYLNTTLVPCI